MDALESMLKLTATYGVALVLSAVVIMFLCAVGWRILQVLGPNGWGREIAQTHIDFVRSAQAIGSQQLALLQQHDAASRMAVADVAAMRSAAVRACELTEEYCRSANADSRILAIVGDLRQELQRIT